jgi:hypothetical protein
VISDGFQKLESLYFWMTPSPYQKIRPQDEQQPRNFRATSGVASGVTSAATSAATSAESSAQHPVNDPSNFRATAETCPGSWRETSHKTPMNVRAKVCTKVGAMVRKRLGNYRRSPRRIR